MFELTINGTVFKFRFGIGFVREMNKRVQRPIDGIPDVKDEVGLRYAVANLYEGDVLALIDVLDTANKTEEPRITRQMLEKYIEDERTNIDELFEKVLDFLKTANATKKAVAFVEKVAQQQQA